MTAFRILPVITALTFLPVATMVVELTSTMARTLSVRHPPLAEHVLALLVILYRDLKARCCFQSPLHLEAALRTVSVITISFLLELVVMVVA